MKRLIKYKWTSLIILAILVIILMPGEDVPEVGFSIPYFDKIVHGTMFFTLGAVFNGEYFWRQKKLPKFLSSWPVLIAFAYSTEVMQLFVPGRSYDLFDFLVDSIGIILGSLLISLWGKEVLKNLFKN